MKRGSISRFYLAVIAACFLLAADGGQAFAGTVNQYGGIYNNWPDDNEWTPIYSLNDPDDGIAERLDFVGDAASPGAYLAVDDNYFYARARLDVGTVTLSTFDDSVFLLIDKVGTTNLLPDYAIAWDTKGAVKVEHGMEFMVPDTTGLTWATTKMNDIDGSSGQKIAPPDFSTAGGDGYIRTIDGIATASFGTTSFLDYAVSWNYLAAHSTLARDQVWRIQFGTIATATDHNFITSDIAGGSNPTSLGLDWSKETLMSDPPVELPEPATLLSFSLALVGVIWKRRRG